MRIQVDDQVRFKANRRYDRLVDRLRKLCIENKKDQQQLIEGAIGKVVRPINGMRNFYRVKFDFGTFDMPEYWLVVPRPKMTGHHLTNIFKDEI